MTQHIIRLFPLLLGLAVGIGGCNTPVDPPIRNNPKDPGGINWETTRPAIQSVTLTGTGSVMIIFVSTSKYAVEFRIERRIAFTGTYSTIGTMSATATTNAFYDTSVIPKGYTYGYRVGLVGSGGTVTYSYDYDIDIF